MSTAEPDDRFVHRHIGPDRSEKAGMLEALGEPSMEAFLKGVIPASIWTEHPLRIGPALSEHKLLKRLKSIASKNTIYRSLIGMGYHGTITPTVVQRNVLENPGWYTAYTPYQAEIAQGRLEALLTYQTLVIDLTGLDMANASLLDEATAAAEAMTMFHAARGRPRDAAFLVSNECHPQTIAVIQTRALPLGISVFVGDTSTFQFTTRVIGALVQYPATDGAIHDYREFCERAHAADAKVAVAADLLSLTLLTSPGEFGADCAVGSTQRFGVPMGYGGPHAAFISARNEFKRFMPGRIIGLSVDTHGKPALRMALQTREQHIRREKATSNICTAQVLLAVMAAFYAVYHGPAGLKRIAERIYDLKGLLARGAERLGHRVVHQDVFDTLRIVPSESTGPGILRAAEDRKFNLRIYEDGSLGLSLDEETDADEVDLLLEVLAGGADPGFGSADLSGGHDRGYDGAMVRRSAYLQHPVFNSYHSETEMLRYLHLLESRDLALNVSMIPLGSCTMKLNATTQMIPVTWPEFAGLHPFAPPEQAAGYHQLFSELSEWLADITGLPAVSLQPNAGAQGEFAGLLTIRQYHHERHQGHRDVCLIPSSAHGTNPASAIMAGMKVVIVRCDEQGNIDLQDLQEKAEEQRERLAALMVTYPSTHGVFEEAIKEVCAVTHRNGGQVYMDGANLNAQVGLCLPAELGADVCHINLHKTFCIPHGGGGPGMGPIAVASHLARYLPGHPVTPTGGQKPIGPVSAAAWGSPNIMVISWAYIALMGGEGLREATSTAILNANYMAKRLEDHYMILYRGNGGRVAHEFILDVRPLKERSGVDAEDVAKRLIDYGFHAPTVSFPVPGTLMIEPTESESRDELDRFCDALIAIRSEIREIETGEADPVNNPLKNSPHTAAAVASDSWNLPYGREKAAFPTAWTRAHKFWPAVGRINNAYGDRNLVCACPPTSDYGEGK
ncbi:MAG: aminomethyl-transferring glycine dehydrogenase [Bacteroidota bacterium]